METISQATPHWIARTGSQIDRIRINALTRETVAGRLCWIKRRTALSHWLVPVANGFFRLARNPVRVLPTGPRWQKREREIFHLLNGLDLKAENVGDRAVLSESLAGTDLVALLKTGRLSSEIMRLVGSAFAKMHRAQDPETGKSFSHGDPHLGNVVFYGLEERIGWLDFETKHLPVLSETERRADDLLVFLLDLAGRVDFAEWKRWSVVFLEGYGSAEVQEKLRLRLVPPRGFAAIWWSVRTSYLPKGELLRRLEWLHNAL